MRVLILKNAAHEGPGLLQEYLAVAGEPVRVLEPEALRQPVDPGDYDVLAAMGGPMNVYETDRHPHLEQVDRTMEAALAAGRPVLGFCLGAQQLVKVTGGKVIPNGAREIGNYDILINERGRADPIFAGFPARTPTFQWHGDRMVPASESQILAASELCPVQAVRVAPRAYGMQFHLEVMPAMVELWCRVSAGEITAERLDPALVTARFRDRYEEFRRLAWRLFDNFFETIAEG